MYDFVPFVSATIAFIAMAYFLLEFQFVGTRKAIAAKISQLVHRFR